MQTEPLASLPVQALLLVGQLHSMDAIAADFSELLGRKVKLLITVLVLILSRKIN